MRPYLPFFRNMIALMAIYSLCRLLFLYFNWADYEQLSLWALLKAMVLGLRFDLAALAVINALPFIILHFPKQPLRLKLARFLYFLINVPFLLLAIADTEYAKFTGKRTSLSILGIATDAGNQAANLAKKYWYLSVLLGATVLLYWWLLKKWICRPNTRHHNTKIAFGSFVFMLGLLLLAFRGGLQTKPLRPSHAFGQSKYELGNLTLNSPFVFVKSIGSTSLQVLNYMEEKDLQKYFRNQHVGAIVNWQQPQNVVLIIVESLNYEYLGNPKEGRGFTPFLDSLAKTGLSMHQHYANGRESIDAVPALLASVPRLMDQPYITSAYQTNKLHALPHILLQKGYQTSFYHGARNGSMGFDAFGKLAGIQQYSGMDEYPVATDYDGNWGIADEPYLQFFGQELSLKKQPFFATVFTLSSHVPYTIPAKYKGKFAKGTHPFHEAMGYADYALRRFFDTAKNKNWYTNTLFVITGDHTHHDGSQTTNNIADKYHVPLIFYHADTTLLNKLKAATDAQKVCQHADVMPSILHYLGIDNPDALPFGASVFGYSCQGLAINYSQGNSWLLKSNSISRGTDGRFVSEKTNNKIVTCKVQNSDNEHRALLQYYRNGLLKNSWFHK
jgi:phosphoglycerol transferase MdoB-like AlkP superfamily enzyme